MSVRHVRATLLADPAQQGVSSARLRTGRINIFSPHFEGKSAVDPFIAPFTDPEEPFEGVDNIVFGVVPVIIHEPTSFYLLANSLAGRMIL